MNEIPTYPYEEEDSPEYKIKQLTDKVEELESTNKALRHELSRDIAISGELQRHLRFELAVWSNATFGDPSQRGPRGPLLHLAKEAAEAATGAPRAGREPSEAFVTELWDCQSILWDAMRRAGVVDSQIVKAGIRKLEICKSREWPAPTSDEPVEHIRQEHGPECACRTCLVEMKSRVALLWLHTENRSEERIRGIEETARAWERKTREARQAIRDWYESRIYDLGQAKRSHALEGLLAIARTLTPSGVRKLNAMECEHCHATTPDGVTGFNHAVGCPELGQTPGAEGPKGHAGAFGWRSDETLMQAYQRVCLELESARELLVLLWRERAVLPSGLVEQIRPWTTSSPAPQTFEQAWAHKEAEGYQYGEDALEQVRMGWEMAKGLI